MSFPHGFKSKLYNWWVKYCPLPKFLKLDKKVCCHEKPNIETVEASAIAKTIEGVVVQFGNKGYGFITGDDNEKYFVHQNNIYNNLPLAVDTRVTFLAESSEKGLVAMNVELEKSSTTESLDTHSESDDEVNETVKTNPVSLSKNKLSKMTKKDLLVLTQDMDIELPKKSTKAVIIKALMNSK